MTACVDTVGRGGLYGKRIHTDGVTKKGDPNNHQDRLKTFKRDPQPWPLQHPSPEDLARAGFIYTGQGTQVNCLFCGIYVEDWKDPRIDPVHKHYTISKSCRFLLAHHAQRVHDFFINSNYSDASLRLKSFLHWPGSAPVRPSDLVSAGFYYVGEGTKVRCFSCSVTYTDWKPYDTPMQIHEQLNPSCEFLLNGATINIDVPVRLPDYSSQEVRLKSLKHWTKDIIGSKEELAEAGLYLVESPDVLRCYACRVELKDWAPGDTAMGKHLKNSPQCPLVQLPARMSRMNIYPHNTISSLSVPTSGLQKQKPLTHEGGGLYPHPSDLPRRHSDRSVYLPPSYVTTSVPLSYARSSSFPNEPAEQAPMQWASSVLCSGDIKTDSPSPRWMLEAGVDIRLPPSLDVKRRSAQTYTVEPPTSASRYTVRPVSVPTTAPTPSFLTTPPPPSLTISPPSSLTTSPPPSPLATSPSSSPTRFHTAMSPSAMPGRIVSGSALDDSKLCQICFENPLGMVFIPCGHVCTCESCAAKVSNCPLCRRTIEQSFRFFLP